MAVWNGETYLARSITSILDQSFKDFEFIIVDDSSDDGTPGILNQFATRDSRIKLLHNDTNLGLAASLNRGMAIVESDYIVRQDDDDVSLPNRIADQLAFLDGHPEVGVLGSVAEIIDEDERSMGLYTMPGDHHLIAWSFAIGLNAIPHPTAVIRTSVVKRAEGYNADFTTGLDYDLWTRLMGETRFANLPDTLVRLCLHPGRESVRWKRAQKRNGEIVLDRLFHKLLGTAPDASDLRCMIAFSDPSQGGISQTALDTALPWVKRIHAALGEKLELSPSELSDIEDDLNARTALCAKYIAARNSKSIAD